MHVVVSMADYAIRDTVELAQWILGNAKDIDGTGVTIRMKDGAQVTMFTGIYKRRPGDAAAVALRLSMKLAKAGDSA